MDNAYIQVWPTLGVDNMVKGGRACCEGIDNYFIFFGILSPGKQVYYYIITTTSHMHVTHTGSLELSDSDPSEMMAITGNVDGVTAGNGDTKLVTGE